MAKEGGGCGRLVEELKAAGGGGGGGLFDWTRGGGGGGAPRAVRPLGPFPLRLRETFEVY